MEKLIQIVSLHVHCMCLIFADNQLARLYLVLQHLIKEQQEMIRLSWLFLIDTHILHVPFRLFLSPEL